jgi:hypothetical protein
LVKDRAEELDAMRMRGYIVAEGCGLGAAIIGVTALIGHLAGLAPLYTWTNGTAMAFPTAVGLTLCGIGIFVGLKR